MSNTERASSSVTSWTVKRLTEAVDQEDAEFRVILPRFQRSVVWSDDQKRALIDSMTKGFPVGAVLAYQRAENARSFELIDGLQRTSTLCEYQRRPLAWAPTTILEDLPQLLEPFEGDLEQLEAAERTLVVQAIHDAVGAWMAATETTTMRAGFTPGKLLARLREAFSGNYDSLPSLAELDADEAFADFLDALDKALDISNAEIPFIQFQGDARDLPEVFERLNQEGTKLSKYQVFAATWIDATTSIDSDEVRAAINRRYEDLWEAGFEVDGLERGVVPDTYSLFEYLFGLGKVIGAKFPELFAARDSASEEPAPFMLFALHDGHSPNDLEKLPDWMPRAKSRGSDVIDPAAMEEAVLESLEFVRSAISPFLSLILNSDPKKKVQKWPHGDYQAMSYSARAAASRRIGAPGTPAFKKDRSDLRSCIPAHYLFDLLSKTWRGPLYSLVYESVWAKAEGSELSPSGRYLTRPGRASAESILDEWFENDQLSRNQRSRPNIRPAEKVFLRFLYANIVTHHQNQVQSFELEHLFPVSRLSSLVNLSGDGWPISCISNLALFPKKLNREKSKLTISEYLAKRSQSERAKTLKDIRPYLLCEVDEVAMPRKNDADALTKEAYLAFLRKRWGRMRDAVLENLGYD